MRLKTRCLDLIIKEAENEESQPHNKRDRFAALYVNNEAEKGVPQLQSNNEATF